MGECSNLLPTPPNRSSDARRASTTHRPSALPSHRTAVCLQRRFWSNTFKPKKQNNYHANTPPPVYIQQSTSGGWGGTEEDTSRSAAATFASGNALWYDDPAAGEEGENLQEKEGRDAMTGSTKTLLLELLRYSSVQWNA
eukprot:CAMPEP_0183731288 /NCGR_PEP_ID=MMETSP0737-20130205/34959_1 /TAXON_ID=385413 /ORGANISM="Thalassiosira miniscula, Strain CCMP1093" /LENGTH=139 /DNA_ID=CAMNT_0025963979 /DNA_START=91 /DNA_END=507 /DNA_ORIENTATION=-